jgi:hypothetical protein
MLESEENITAALNEGGILAAAAALDQFDTDGSPIIMGDTKWTTKGKASKTYQTPWGETQVKRHVYQTSKGGRLFCPLERDARVILTSTPGFAKMAASKYADMGSSRVLFDLEQNHQRVIARSYLKDLCDAVGAIAQAKEEVWSYEVPELSAPVANVAVGLDGTCMLLTTSGWREAMVGTISLYDSEGERLHTIQMGATPEYGKASFYRRFDREIDRIKERYPRACYVGVADGAKSNWDYLKERTERQTVDFWHACGYLGKAAEAMFRGKRQELVRREWLDASCHRLKHKVGAASRLLTELQFHRDTHTLRGDDQEKLDKAICYFTNNKGRMKYAGNLKSHLPIGSGVTEAACKTLVKQRLCNSGMRWKEKGAAAVLSLRSLAHTDCRWDQFWGKVSQYGFSMDV